ncbi:hypothetical protein [Taibaiella chishuiensis]|uniref:Uncharacterized protein n=1 Tax=Taibaiella chishuiensis TaxID=1434707 RepID=A0A2P8D0R4_9BACT|nr:hypothetical protein [Taibaiella chishuiensis]PSK90813.1 hypothetical protein B0I18_107225 [Taibaiella chishuiensis]
MNRKKNALTDLIGSLSMAEKRHFSLFSAAFGKKENKSLYVKLFELLDGNVSESSDLETEFTPMALAKTKQRLYNNLLKGLRIFYEGMSVEIDIQNMLTEIEILYKRALPAQANEILSKSLALANDHEKFGLVLQLLKWEKRINIVIDTPSRSQPEIADDEKNTLGKLVQISTLESIYGRIMEFKKLYGYAKGDLKTQLEKETVGSKEMPLLEECRSNEARFYHNFINSIYHWMIYEHKQAYMFSGTLINPGSSTILPSIHISALLQHITSSVCIGEFKTALQGIELSEAYIDQYHLNQSPTYNTLMFAYHATYQLIIYNYMGRKSKLKDAIKTTEAKLKLYENSLSLELKQILMGNLMNAYVGIGDIKSADVIWDSIFNKQTKTLRRDIYADLYLFRLFSLLYNKTYVLLPSAALSASRYYKKFDDAKTVYQVELPLSMLLTKNIDYDNPAALAKVLKEIRGVIQKFISGLKGANNFQEHYSRYLIWIDSMLANEPYSKVAAAWYSGLSRK